MLRRMVMVSSPTNFFKQESHDSLAFDDTMRFGGAAQASKECVEGFCEAQEGCALVSLVGDRRQFSTECLLAVIQRAVVPGRSHTRPTLRAHHAHPYRSARLAETSGAAIGRVAKHATRSQSELQDARNLQNASCILLSVDVPVIGIRPWTKSVQAPE
jgi:hypothetical protein